MALPEEQLLLPPPTLTMFHPFLRIPFEGGGQGYMHATTAKPNSIISGKAKAKQAAPHSQGLPRKSLSDTCRKRFT